MMNKEAIQKIQEATSIPALIKQLAEVKTQVPVIATPQDMSISSLEKFMPLASRYRMGYETTSIADFVEYNEEYDAEGAKCFVDAESMKARSIFDLGTVKLPGHKEHTASIRLKKTVPFSAFCRISGDAMNQQTASDFIMDWSDFISTIATTEGSQMTATLAANAMRDITIAQAKERTSQVGDFGSRMSEMEQIEAKNKHSIPSVIRFKCRPFLGLDVREFTMKVSLLIGGEHPRISLRILGLEAIMEGIAEEFKAILVESFEDLSLKAYIGEA